VLHAMNVGAKRLNGFRSFDVHDDFGSILPSSNASVDLHS
jgi:hypothetical protein